jgi:hypothetical protein
LRSHDSLNGRARTEPPNDARAFDRLAGAEPPQHPHRVRLHRDAAADRVPSLTALDELDIESGST